MRRRIGGLSHLLGVASGLLLCAWLTPAAYACNLDGIASLSVNGNVASLTTSRPTASNLGYWSRFTLLAAAPGDTLRFSENLANVSLSIPAASTKLPFSWSFGDGSSAVGQSVSHRYARTGWYKVTARYYWPARRQWVEFDSAEQHIVPQSDLLWANFGHYAGSAFVTVLRIVIWAALAMVFAWMVLDRLVPLVRKRGARLHS